MTRPAVPSARHRRPAALRALALLVGLVIGVLAGGQVIAFAGIAGGHDAAPVEETASARIGAPHRQAVQAGPVATPGPFGDGSAPIATSTVPAEGFASRLGAAGGPLGEPPLRGPPAFVVR